MRIVFVMLVVLMLAATSVVAAQEKPAPAQPTQDEISSLRLEIAELRAALTALQVAQPERQISIGVMPIENAGRIPQVGNSFRQVLVSALNEDGIKAQESLDDETLRWVQRQDQLVRERWIDPRSAPRRGELSGATHFLLGTVTRYEEKDNETINAIAGQLGAKGGVVVRVRTGTLVVDFRLVDAHSGVSEDSFRTEAKVRMEEFTAGGALGPLGGLQYRCQEPLPERAARAVARQAAERIAALVAPALPKPQPAKPAAAKK